MLDQSRLSAESHVFAKIRPIELEYPPDQLDLAFEHIADRERVNFHVKNVFSRNDESGEQHPAPQFDAVRKDAIVLPEVFQGSLRHVYGRVS